MKITTMRKVSDKVSAFYNGYNSIILFMSLTTVFVFLQSLLFGFGVININGTHYNNEDSRLVILAWTSIILSMISCYTGFMGAIANIKGSNTFLIWMTIQLALLAMVAFMAGAVFAAISSTYGIVSAYVRYFIWKNELIEKWNLSKQKIIIISIIILIITLVSLNMIVILFSENSNLWDNSETNKWLWYFDSTGSSLEICAYTMLIFKVWWAFLFFFISKFFFATIYLMTGNGVSLVQMLLFATTDISGMLSWYFVNKDQWSR